MLNNLAAKCDPVSNNWNTTEKLIVGGAGKFLAKINSDFDAFYWLNYLSKHTIISNFII
jgi:hypothetical protein